MLGRRRLGRGSTSWSMPELRMVAEEIRIGDGPAAIAGLAHADIPPEGLWQSLQLRHLAFETWDRPPAAPTPDRSFHTADGIPELPSADLSPDAIRSAIMRAGSAIVRQGLAAQDVGVLASGSRRVLTANHQDLPPGWHHEFRGSNQNHITYSRRLFEETLNRTGGLLVDFPTLTDAYIRALSESGLRRVIIDYLGGAAAFTAQKAVVRRVPPSAKTGWHQDGAFLGASCRALNVWVSLTTCGLTAPGMDMLPIGLDRIVERGTGDAPFSWAVGSSVVDSVRGSAPVVRAEYLPGDVVLFDQFNLHSTAASPEMVHDRLAIECWFFDPATIPDGYTGLLL